MSSPNKSEKENYLKETELSLKKFRSQITILEKWIAEAEADIKARNEQKMDQILGQYAQAMDKLETLGKVAPDAWRDRKTELDRAIDALSELVDTMALQILV